MTFGLDVEALDVARLAKAVGWPEFRGTLSGRIPRARYAGDRLEFDGGLSMEMFDGTVSVSSLSMERPFGTAPSLAADIDFDDIDLLALTEVLDFGSITGRLDGRIHALRLVDWTATAFDAELRTDRKRGVPQRIIATRDQSGRYAMVYVPKKNKTFTIYTANLSGAIIKAWWYDCRNGRATNAGQFNKNSGGGYRTFTTPNVGQDWVLVLDDKTQGFAKPGIGGPLP